MVAEHEGVDDSGVMVVCITSLWKKCVSADTEAETQTPKKLQIRSSLRFGPVSEGQNTFFPQNTFFLKTGWDGIKIKTCHGLFSELYIYLDRKIDVRHHNDS